MINGIQNQMKADGITLVNNVRASIEKAGIKNIDKIQDIIDATYEYADGGLWYIGITGKDKTLIAGTSKESIGEKIDSSGSDSVFEGNTDSYIYEWQGKKPAYNVSVPIEDGNSVVYSLSIGISVDNMQKAIRTTIIKSAICIAITALMLSAIMGIYIRRRIAKPIEIN